MAEHAIDISSIQRGSKMNAAEETTCLEVKDFNLFYGDKQALHGVNMTIPKNRVTAFIGPSGCGKSTLLRCFNRMNDLIDSVNIDGQMLLDGDDLNSRSVNVADLRRQVGMVFQKPNPFPKSIYENVAYGLRLQGVNDRATLDNVVEKSLKGAALWDEVKDRLHESAMGMSGGQQQRLAIARALAMEPSYMLFDEVTSALDPELVGEVLDTLRLLREDGMTMIVVTHEINFARDVSDRIAFFHQGVIEELAPAKDLVNNPQRERTQQFLSKVL